MPWLQDSLGLGARARAASLDHHQTSLDIHPSLMVWGLERKETEICVQFVAFFQGILGPLAFNFIKIPDIWTRSMAD